MNWSVAELTQLDIKFRKLLSVNGAHHLKGDVDRLYLPRDMGGRGFLSVRKRSLSGYLHNSSESVLLNARAVLRIAANGHSR